MLKDVIMREMSQEETGGGQAERLCNTAPQPWHPYRAGFM
jgi:hypothetical protein